MANSQGQPLLQHLQYVSELAGDLAKNLKLSDDLVEVVKIAGLLHDIGKAEPSFQKYIQKKIKNPDYENEYEGALHNEVGWAFLARNGFWFKDVATTSVILNAVYWHHGITDYTHQKDFDKIGKILDGISETEIKDFYDKILPKLPFNDNQKQKLENEVPKYIAECPDSYLDNPLLFIVRSCVVKADRLVSGEKEIKVTTKINENVLCPTKYDFERFNEQKDFAIKASNAKTTQINAPAGFGKTMIGLLWHSQIGKKTYWVVPRNTIAVGVYENLKKEIENLNLDVSVELFLTGEQKAKNKESVFFDITVTNIDNLMAPIVGMNRAEIAYDAFAGNIIFDEYHEFAQKGNGIYAAFVNMMAARNELCNSKTLLLSATPSIHSYIWDEHAENKTLILPKPNEWCKPAHSKTYNIEVIDKELPPHTPSHSLHIHNSVANTQKAWVEDNETKIYHSSYTEIHKKQHNEELLKNYGKHIGTHFTDKVAAAPIIQAALDISFANLSESVLSPESTVQRVGRCNRWGWEEIADVKIYTGANKNEQGAIRTLFDNDIRNLWIDFVKTNLVGEFTLAGIYERYGEFNTKYETELKNYYKKLLKESVEAMSELLPMRYHGKSKDGKIVATKRPTLRALRPSLFFVVKQAHNKEWLPFDNGKNVMSMDIANLTKISQNNLIAPKNLDKELTKLEKLGYGKYHSDRKIKGKIKNSSASSAGRCFDNAKVFKNSNNQDTPYPIGEGIMVYHYNQTDKRGLVKEQKQ